MATLTEVAYIARRTIKYGSIGIVAFLVLRVIFGIAIAWWQQLHPPPPPPPTVSFGKLPKIEFPTNGVGTLNYILQLPTTDFPAFADRAKVFVIPYQTATFLAPDEAKTEAARLGFTQEPETLSSQVYRFTKLSPLSTTLDMNIIDGSYEYNYPWQEDTSILEQKNLLGEQQAITETKSFLSKIKSLEQDLDTGQSKVSYWRVSGTKLVPAVSFSEADFVRVDLFRAPIEDMPAVTADPTQGIVSALLSGSADQRFLKINFKYFAVNYSLYGTYPVKTAAEAWQELKAGGGYIASVKEKTTNVVIRRVYLAYFDSFSPQKYLQPVFVFTGDDDFIGFVPAIVDTWYQ
jgi:hypothetical protein